MEIVSLGEDSLDSHDLGIVKVQSKRLRYDIKKFIYWYATRPCRGYGVAVFLDKNDK